MPERYFDEAPRNFLKKKFYAATLPPTLPERQGIPTHMPRYPFAYAKVSLCILQVVRANRQSWSFAYQDLCMYPSKYIALSYVALHKNSYEVSILFTSMVPKPLSSTPFGVALSLHGINS